MSIEANLGGAASIKQRAARVNGYKAALERVVNEAVSPLSSTVERPPWGGITAIAS